MRVAAERFCLEDLPQEAMEVEQQLKETVAAVKVTQLAGHAKYASFEDKLAGGNIDLARISAM